MARTRLLLALVAVLALVLLAGCGGSKRHPGKVVVPAPPPAPPTVTKAKPVTSDLPDLCRALSPATFRSFAQSPLQSTLPYQPDKKTRGCEFMLARGAVSVLVHHTSDFLKMRVSLAAKPLPSLGFKAWDDSQGDVYGERGDFVYGVRLLGPLAKASTNHPGGEALAIVLLKKLMAAAVPQPSVVPVPAQTGPTKTVPLTPTTTTPARKKDRASIATVPVQTAPTTTAPTTTTKP